MFFSVCLCEIVFVYETLVSKCNSFLPVFFFFFDFCEILLSDCVAIELGVVEFLSSGGVHMGNLFIMRLLLPA